MRGAWSTGWKATAGGRNELPVEFRGGDFSRVPVLESRPRPSNVDQ